MNAKTFFPRLVAVILLATCLIFPACDDDDARDGNAPIVEFVNLTREMTVRSTVVVEVSVTDEGELSPIELLVDDNLVATDAEPPYEFSWDSNTVSDGRHLVTAVARDKAGNFNAYGIYVNVVNTLVTISIGANQLDLDPKWSERGFVFLSDADGKLIASTEYFNGSTVALKSGTFNGEKFYLTEVLIQKNESNGSFARAWTYANVERAKTWTVVDDIEDKDPTYVGQANLSFTNPVANFYYSGNSRDENVSYTEFGSTSSIRLTKSPALLYLVRYPNDDQTGIEPTYNLYPNIVVGNNTINLSLANKPLTKVTPAFPSDVLYASVELEGYTAADDFSDPYSIDYFSTSGPQLNIYYPGTAFPSYYAETYYETGKIGYYRGAPSTSFALPQIQNNVAFTFNGGKLAYTATGSQDFTTTLFFNQDETAYWSLVLPHASESTVIPAIQIPDALKSFNFPAFSLPESFGVYDLEEITSYEGLLNYVHFSANSVERLYAAGRTFTDIQYYSSSTNGRVKNTRARYKPFGKLLRQQ